VVAGKPEAPLFTTAARHLGSDRPLVVGDRLDTDILGGNRAGMDTALILTGVDTARTALAAVAAERPTYLLPDLGGLYEPYPPVTAVDGAYRCGSDSARSTREPFGWRAAKAASTPGGRPALPGGRLRPGWRRPGCRISASPAQRPEPGRCDNVRTDGGGNRARRRRRRSR
jgi:hypothetical protein